MKRSIDESKEQPPNKRVKASNGPPLLGVLLFNKESEEKMEEGLMEEERSSDVRVLEFNDQDEVLFHNINLLKVNF